MRRTCGGFTGPRSCPQLVPPLSTSTPTCSVRRFATLRPVIPATSNTTSAKARTPPPRPKTALGWMHTARSTLGSVGSGSFLFAQVRGGESFTTNPCESRGPKRFAFRRRLQLANASVGSGAGRPFAELADQPVLRLSRMGLDATARKTHSLSLRISLSFVSLEWAWTQLPAILIR